MSRIERVLTLALISVSVTVAAGTTPVQAAVPTQMNFQGILLDDDLGTVVDSTYLIRFTIYDDSTGGLTLWTEDQEVTTENGLFNTFFGLVNPVPGTVFDGVYRWLEIELVGVGAYEPRTRIGTVGYAYRVESVNGATGGDIYGDIMLHSTLTIGDLDGNPGILQLTNGDSVTLIIDGTEDFVIMPDSSIPVTDIINEPGLAANFNSARQTLPQGTLSMMDLVTVTITTPTDGYIVVDGRATFLAQGSKWRNVARFQIDEAAGGADDPTHYAEVGALLDDDPVISGTTQSTANTSGVSRSAVTGRIYYKPAGTYTFRLEGRAIEDNNSSAVSKVENAFITATFHPTSYGTVETAVTSSSASAFDNPTLIPTSGTGNSSESYYRVNLRDLEMRAAQLEAELERTRRLLAESRLRQQ